MFFFVTASIASAVALATSSLVVSCEDEQVPPFGAGQVPLLLLSPSEMLERGLQFVGYIDKHRQVKHDTKEERFRRNLGSSAGVLAILWSDLQTAEVAEARIHSPSQRNLDYFLLANYFLFNYATGANIEGIFNGIGCEKTNRGHIWDMVRRIAALREEKIVWPLEWDSDEEGVPIFLYSVDGTHFPTQEQPHPLYNQDPKWFSYKLHRAGVSYTIALDLWHDRVVFYSGPHPASVHDKTIYREPDGLMELTPMGKRGIADNGYIADDLKHYLSYSNSLDSDEVRKFKARAKSRQETFNERIANFGCLANTFRHSIDKHADVFEAVVVIVQYQMENGAPLFEV